MLRIVLGAAALTLFAPWAFACEGQTGKVIFEDKFTDDTGGWVFGADWSLLLKPPGATVTVAAANEGASTAILNQTFTATLGDFCTEGTFPANAEQLNAGIGVVFWGIDYSNYWSAAAYADGSVNLSKLANNQWSTIFETMTKNVVKTSPADVNSVRAVVKNGTITVIVNGQTVKSVRAQFPSGDLKFGFRRSYRKSSTAEVLFNAGPYKVTTAE
ncbi:MAG: hypothetical protein L0Y57_08250 [Beijerinckiaceae bacterium]|nr:hypothetical protein [Beijerinckiaceae bacterium]